MNIARSGRAVGLCVGLVLSGLTLAACQAAPVTTQSVTPSESPRQSSATASPEPTPTEAQPRESVIDFDGVGAFHVGATVTDAVGAVRPPYVVASPSSCPNPATTILESDSSPTIWLQELTDTGRIDVVAVGGDVPDDAREAGSPRTESGVGIGSTLGEVETAYPDGALESNAEGEPDRFVVAGVGSSGDARYIVFSLFGNDVQTILVQASPDKIWEFCG